jgi:hypothetical protein
MADRSFVVPVEVATAERSGWVSSGGGFPNLTQKIRTGKPVVIRFLSNPLTCDRNTDWTIYREVGAWEGLMDGRDMPGGLMEFPVFDVEYFEQDGVIMRRQAPRGSDLLFDSVKPDKNDKKNGRNRAQANDMIAFNAIVESGDFGGKADFNPQPGQHVIIKMSKPKGLAVIRGLEERDMELDNFDPLQGAWKLALIGTPPTTELTMNRVKVEPLDPEEIPEIINITEYMTSVREAAEAFFESGVSGGSIEADEAIFGGDEEIDEVIDEFEEKAKGPDYSVMSPARLKTLLKEAGVEIPARATTAKLIALAQENL